MKKGKNRETFTVNRSTEVESGQLNAQKKRLSSFIAGSGIKNSQVVRVRKLMKYGFLIGIQNQ